jgi:ABC-2 type transport system permease protein
VAAEPDTGLRASGDLRVVAPRRSVSAHVHDVWSYRELLVGLVRKELKVKYKNSVLGFAWSLLNPLLYLAVYTFVFDFLLNSGIDAFPIFLLSGLLVWTLFSTALISSTSSIAEGGSLIKKVFFPREILPLASVGAAFIHFLLQFLVLAAVLVVTRWDVAWSYLWLTVPALAVTLLLAAALAVLLSAVNVYARDTKHLLEVVMLAWFWVTPIVWHYMLFGERLAQRGQSWLMLLNPMTSVVIAMQRGIYGRAFSDGGTALLPDASVWWYLRNLGIVGLVALLLLVFAIRVFDRLEGNFSEVI